MKVIVEFDTLEQATVAIKAALGEPVDAKETKAPKSTKASSGAKAASEPQQAAPATPETPTTLSSPSTQASAAAPATAATGGVSYDDVKAAVLAAKRETVLALFKTFGVAKAPDLKPEQYVSFLEALTKASAPAAEEALV